MQCIQCRIQKTQETKNVKIEEEKTRKKVHNKIQPQVKCSQSVRRYTIYDLVFIDIAGVCIKIQLQVKRIYAVNRFIDTVCICPLVFIDIAGETGL